MAFLYIDEYGAKVNIEDGLLNVELKGVKKRQLRIQELDSVVLVENCILTSAAISYFLRHNVSVSFLSGNGEFLGCLESKYGKNVLIRYKQYEFTKDDIFCLQLAKRFVAGKLANMRTILMRYKRSKIVSNSFDKSISRLKEFATMAGESDNEKALLGIEGSGSREYFNALKEIISEPYHFDGRNRRPPEDCVNAMLGFAYALLEHFVQRSVYLAGLDPYLGFYHKMQYGRESLVLDLMEVMRPVIADSVVLNCTNRKLLSPDSDFEKRNEGIYLNEKGREKFVSIFYNRMKNTYKDINGNTMSFDKICDAQAEALVRAISERNPKLYKPFLVK